MKANAGTPQSPTAATVEFADRRRKSTIAAGTPRLPNIISATPSHTHKKITIKLAKLVTFH